MSDQTSASPSENAAGSCVFSRDLFGVRVRFESGLLGTGYLKNPANNPPELFRREHVTRIQNVVALNLAKRALCDGQERCNGMWTVEPVSSPNTIVLPSVDLHELVSHP